MLIDTITIRVTTERSEFPGDLTEAEIDAIKELHRTLQAVADDFEEEDEFDVTLS